MLLAALMLVGALTSLGAINAFADEPSEGTTTEETTVEEGTSAEEEDGANIENYVNIVYATPEEKLATMKLKVSKGNYQIYVDEASGEVATVNVKTGDILFTNPYDIGASKGSESKKGEVLSQIIVKFTDNDTDKYFYSYEMAALRDQIVVKNIKSGIRVEYTIGKDQSRSLLPRQISKERFESVILPVMQENMSDNMFQYEKFLAYYKEMNLEKLTSEKAKKDLIKNFPIAEKMAFYVFDPTATDVQVNQMEELVKTYCPDYTYEDLDYDHNLTQYEAEDENPPVFKMALEYTLDDDGVSVRLPANGIRFNESLYQLDYISVLPFMGAGNGNYDGYNFYPDGSGAIFSYEDFINDSQGFNTTGKVYGSDYAYHQITGTYQQPISYPVFGIVEETKYHTFTTINDNGDEVSTKINGAIINKINEGKAAALEVKYNNIINDVFALEEISTEKRGYMCIIEEGDALASISTNMMGSLHDYHSMRMDFNPRPKDSYNVADSISVGSNTTWTVVSKRKYVGNYKMKYIILSDTTPVQDENGAVVAEADGVKKYDASWFGMAVAYRDYLTEQGILTKLSSEDVEKDIPLYIETFGTLETLEKVLSLPVYVMTPLTTFEDVKTMYKDLTGQNNETDTTSENNAEGVVKAEVSPVNNIIFKLTGYANGGLYYTVPYKFDIEKAVGGEDGFQDLLNFANEESKKDEMSLKVFPDFDFSYVQYTDNFDGLTMKKHVSKTIDDRYASLQKWSATQQTYESYYQLAISPAYLSRFYEKTTSDYLKYNNVQGISAGSLGSALNSDFDEDEPYNREDSKAFTITAFEYLDKNYNEVMTSSANAYTWKYVDHILNVALDSSRYNKASNAVPFLGVVLHGSVSIAGEPLNMEGDLSYAILKAIENGASPYFVLSYQNTQELKNTWDYSNYYSVRYDIWKEDIGEVYEKLNYVLADVQDKYIIDHEFLVGERVPDSDELEADILAEILKNQEAELNAAEIERQEQLLAISNARAYVRELAENAKIYKDEALEGYYATYSAYITAIARLESLENALKEVADCENRGWHKLENSRDEQEQDNYQKYLDALSNVTNFRRRSLNQCVQVGKTHLGNLRGKYEEINNGINEAQIAIDLLKATGIKDEFITRAENECLQAMEICNVTSAEYAGSASGHEHKTDSVAGVLSDGTVVYYEINSDNERVYFSISNDLGDCVHYSSFQKSLKDCYEDAQDLFTMVLDKAEELGMDRQDIIDRVNKDSNVVVDKEDEVVVEDTYSKYTAENIVVVTYGNDDGSEYKSIILNYNNYVVTVVYDGVSYTIPPYEYVMILASEKGGKS